MDAPLDLYQPSYYFNRELSWLKFNERVLEEAEDEQHPLLERLKFLAIFSSNLDEFMMIRYAGLKEQLGAGIRKKSFDGRSALEQIQTISERLRPLLKRHAYHMTEVILPSLRKRGVSIVAKEELSAHDLEHLDSYFEDVLFPVLTPLGLDSGNPNPFPRLPNLSFSLFVEIADPEGQEVEHAVVEVPNVLPRFIALPSASAQEQRFIMLEGLIHLKLQELFVGYKVHWAYGFRVTRDADIEIAEDEAEDLLLTIEDEVRKRRWGEAVRLEIVADMPSDVREYLKNSLELSDYDIYPSQHLNPAAFMGLLKLDIPELKDKGFTPRLPSEFRKRSVFEAICRQDILIHYPFHAFDAVLELIQQAARDPDVLAIKQTLYRVGKNSPVVAALAEAAGNGKHVTALVELKARFDEENNIGWARELEQAGVHVVYGFVGLKTHCKALLVARQENHKIRRYIHLATGNYNHSTSNLYTDMALLSCDEALGADVSELFNMLTGFSKQQNWRKLWVAPKNLRQNILAAIDQETAFAEQGRPAKIIAQMNSLVDPEVIRHLYRASMAGVEVDLIVRGVCCLRPQLKGVSERIRVRSIVGRFLEHSRVFYFFHDGAEQVYMGSADWMQRNLNSRVETVFPVESPGPKKKIMEAMALYLRDNDKARELHSDGFYYRVRRQPGQHRLNAQERMLEQSARRQAAENGAK